MATVKHDLHIHSDYSDGSSKVYEIVERAHTLGLAIIAITDHFWPSLGSRRGGISLIERRRREIEDARSYFPDLIILDGAEVDIGSDGSLAEVAGGLEQFDLVIGSFHWSMDSTQWAHALDMALRDPQFQILGHFDGYLTYYREEDGERAAEALAKAGVSVELSGRYQVRHTHFLQVAQEAGCRFSLGSDSHSVESVGRTQFQNRLASDMNLRLKNPIEMLKTKA
ncbi:PHP domain-containing protein [Candidatus Thorarchaeota archaeon]|nr:MAG: PHP domain-containing protein [Candidatus Thorarchaeota archaeon]